MLNSNLKPMLFLLHQIRNDKDLYQDTGFRDIYFRSQRFLRGRFDKTW